MGVGYPGDVGRGVNDMERKLADLDRFGISLWGPKAHAAVQEIDAAVREALAEGRSEWDAAFEYAQGEVPYNRQVWAMADALEQDVMIRIPSDDDDGVTVFLNDDWEPSVWGILRAAVQASIYSIYRACWTLAEEGE